MKEKNYQIGEMVVKSNGKEVLITIGNESVILSNGMTESLGEFLKNVSNK